MFEQAGTIGLAGRKRKRTPSTAILPTPQARHPYLSGNFAPIQQTTPLTPCTYSGTIPRELAGGEYVRNGSNPVSNDDLGRDAHWFDGDGMLAGVSFRQDDSTGAIEPEFVNQFLLTDLYLSTLSSPRLRVPILPSIATLVNPVASFFYVTLRIFRTLLLVLLSHLPGSKQKIKRISVANTAVLYHDGRALATCESGPPLRIQLPGLETVGWFDGVKAEGEPERTHFKDGEKPKVLGEDGGLIAFMREWTTAHPKVDPQTKEMLMFHSSFVPPYVQYSIIPQQDSPAQSPGGSDAQRLCTDQQRQGRLLNAPVTGIHSAKMMHDFGVSLTHTVIMDLPLSLDPMNQLKGKPAVAYDSSKASRFGVFPRRRPEEVTWFETDACCIFHTANTWNDSDAAGRHNSVNMLACRLTSATLVFAAGNVEPPVELVPKAVAAAKRMPFFSKYNHKPGSTISEKLSYGDSVTEQKEALLPIENVAEQATTDEDQCRLYYYNFDLATGQIAHQWALLTIPFEFPSVRPNREMQRARYIYGCSTSTTSFGSALGKATKIDVLVKVDAATLIRRGQARPPRNVTGAVDRRSMAEVLESADEHDAIRAFRMPEGWYAQEPRFVPASSSFEDEDDGYLLFYAFDESQLTPAGDVPSDSSAHRATSELWILNAKNMTDVVARLHLPQRVPYGLHGRWFSAEQIARQRGVESLRTTARALEKKEEGAWMVVRDRIEGMLG